MCLVENVVMTEDAFAARVAKVGALADPIRRRLYRFISRQADPVSRDQAADAVEVPRHTAKFHLERLVDAGLLVTEFRRLTGRTGPGAGRPAKLYRRAATEIAVSLPSRRYDLAGEVLADAAERALGGTGMAAALSAAAEDAARSVVAAAPDAGGAGERLHDTLTALDYEPRDEETEYGRALVLGNCPYRRLAAGHRELVCGLNQRFVEGLADELGRPGGVSRHHDGPGPDGCCVMLTPTP